MNPALFWKPLKEKIVQCKLCPRNCIIPPDKKGFCKVRENQNGKLVSLVYGKLCSIAIDPIEKKPLYHFRPGTFCLSIATVGCNLDCKFCQNWEISHSDKIIGETFSPEEIISMVKERDLPGIAYTYTEPTLGIEFYLEVMKLAKKEGLYNVWVSNGYINPEPVRKVAKYMDAINIDLKGDKGLYQKLCAVPNDEPIKKALLAYKKAGVHIEITMLIIPGWNDRPEIIREIVSWVGNNLGKETPLHFSKFFPNFRLLDVEPTPIKILKKAEKLAKEMGMKNVHLGNI